MKNPYIFWAVFAVILIGAFFIGNSQWAKNFIKGLMSSAPAKPADGTACTATTTGVSGSSIPTSGTYKNGVCVATAGNAGNGSGGAGNGGSGETENLSRMSSSPTAKQMAEINAIMINQNNPNAKQKADACDKIISLCNDYGNPKWCDHYINAICGSGTARSSSQNPPPAILVPYSPDCRAQYTAQHPYKANNCSYVFDTSVQQPIKMNGIQYCQLKLISCP